MWRYGWAAAAASVLLLIAGITANPAYAIVALMVIFIIIPLAMSFVYYNYGLKPLIVALTHYHTAVTLCENSLTVTAIDDEGTTKTSLQIPLSDIREVSAGKTYDTIVYGSAPDCIMLIDASAFDTSGQRHYFHEYISRKTAI